MRKNCPLVLAVLGFSLLGIAGISSWYLFPFIINNQIHKNIDLIEGTQGYEFWQKQPFPLKFKVYLFNVTNAAEVQNGANPIVKEIGPYVYDEYRVKENVEVNEEQDLLKYILKRTFFFNKNDSGCHDPDDYVTIINAALVGTALQVEVMAAAVMSTVSEAIPYLYPEAKDVFMTAKVKDILFDGVRIYCGDENVATVCTAMRGLLPKTMKVAENGVDFLYSLFGHLNGTDDGPWEMGRGIKNTTRGQVYSYLGEPHMTIWGDQYCNSINGSDSTVFEPINGPYRPPRLYAFTQDFCRSLYASYERESEEFGIPAIRYTTKHESLAKSEENECFCPTLKDENFDDYLACPPDGLADITPCLKAPVLISYPHFYLADKKLLKYVSGLNPQKDLHENYVNLEPRSATPLSGRKRVQVNIHLKRFQDFELLKNVSSGIFPVLWIEEGVTLPDDIVQRLTSNFNKIALLDIFKWILIAIGLCLVTSGLFFVLKREKMFCFGSNATVDITAPKVGRQGEINRGFELNPGLIPQLDNKNTLVAGPQKALHQ